MMSNSSGYRFGQFLAAVVCIGIGILVGIGLIKVAVWMVTGAW
ncbi:hypothetical protein SEA_FIRECASTLE_32 [Microbacterium phage FireCastle]